MTKYHHHAILWCVLAFFLRGAYSLTLPNQLLHPDAHAFEGTAWNLVSQGRYALDKPEHGGIVELTALRPPSYPLFLAAVFTVAGHNLLAARIAQALLGALLVWLIFQFTYQLDSDGLAASMAAGMAAFYPFFIYYDSQLIAESFLTLSFLTTLYLFIRWKESPENGGRAFAWGLASATLCLTKTAFIPVIGLCLATESLSALGTSQARRKFLAAALAGLVFAGPIIAWGLRNQKVFGRFLLDSHGGITFLHCTVFYDVYKQGTFGDIFPHTPVYEMAKSMDEAQCNDFFYRIARDYIRTHPRDFARQIVSKTIDFWRLYPRQDVPFQEGVRKITVISLLTEPFLIFLGGIGLWKTRHSWRLLYPLYSAIVLLTAVHAISCSQMRYRLPLMPFAIVFSAMTLTPYVRNLRRSQ